MNPSQPIPSPMPEQPRPAQSEVAGQPLPEQTPAPTPAEFAPPVPASTPAAPAPALPVNNAPATPSTVAASTANTAPQTPAIADDVDVIEKEWVDHANKIIEATSQDPYVEEEAIEDLQVDYLKKRYGKDVKKNTDEEV